MKIRSPVPTGGRRSAKVGMGGKKKGGRSRPYFNACPERSYVALPANWPRVSIAEAHARVHRHGANFFNVLAHHVFAVVRSDVLVFCLNVRAERQELIDANRDHRIC